MTDRFGPGQADKAAAEQRTAQVAAENKAQGQPQAQQPQSQTGQQKARQEEAQRGPKSAADKLAEVDFAPAVSETSAREVDPLVNPYPEYGDLPLDELRALAESRGVGLLPDGERSQLIYNLRSANNHSPVFDHMSLADLRARAREDGVGLSEEFEAAGLISSLRAADTHTH